MEDNAVPPLEGKPSFDSPRKSVSTSPLPSQEDRLKYFRTKLESLEIDAFIVGSADAHFSEYVSDSEARREFISGFTGSAGTALITQEHALLWTDGRYFLSAAAELSPEWTLMKQGEKDVPELQDWLVSNLSGGKTVGVDASLYTASAANTLVTFLKKADITLKPIKENPVDEIWGPWKPPRPTGKAILQPFEYTGQSHLDKINNIRKVLGEKKADGIVFSMLDEVMWLYNIRGSDVPYNPVVYSFAYISTDGAYLFIDKRKMTDISIEGVELREYDDIEDFLLSMAKSDKTILADLNQLNWKLNNAIGSRALKEITSPIKLAKSIKNPTELRGVINAHARDGVALTAFLGWLEKNIQDGAEITEFEASEVLAGYRRRMKYNMGLSFNTIAGYGANGAIIHYRPTVENSSMIQMDSMFLLDSGGQYLDGTTDTTRTVHFGEPTERMKQVYTLVLKGQIALARAVFPEGTLGSRLDTLARFPLWSAGLDYNHGTGHGVGSYLNVHEGPQGISFRKNIHEVGFQKGMITSNEPGYYEEGTFGCRIEDIMITVDGKTPNRFGNKDYCAFQTATMVPKTTKLVDLSLMDDGELEFLNNYNMQVRNCLLKEMQDIFPESVAYLIKETEPLLRC